MTAFAAVRELGLRYSQNMFLSLSIAVYQLFDVRPWLTKENAQNFNLFGYINAIMCSSTRLDIIEANWGALILI